MIRIGKSGRSVLVLCLITVVLIPLRTWGEEGILRQLTLTEAIKTALGNNQYLEAEINSQAAKQEQVGIARSYLLPRIAVEERFQRTDNSTYAFMSKLNQERFTASDFALDSLNHPDAVNDYQTALTIEQPLFLRKAHIGLEMSQVESAASNADLARKKESIAFQVVQQYLNVATAREYVSVSEKALKDAEEHLRLANARLNSDLGLYSDTLRASTAVAEAKQRLVSARKNLSIARRSLGLVLGFSGLFDTASSQPQFLLRTIEYYRTKALERSDLHAMSLKKENAANNVRLAKSYYFPYLGLGGVYQMNDHDTPLGSEGNSWMVTAFLRWQLFDGTKRQHELSKAEYQAKEADAYLEGFENQISFQVEQAWLTFEEADNNRDLARESVKTAEEGCRLVKVRYEGNLSPLVDLMDAQLSLDHARANLVARENDYQLAIATLYHVSGTLLKDLDNIE